MSKIISIVSGKGGVGKTTLAINLAAALQEFNHHNVIVDADVDNPNVHLHLDFPYIPLTLQDVLKGEAHINHAIRVHPSGLKIVPSSHSSTGYTDLSNLGTVLKPLSDTVILDSPPGINNNIRSILDISDKIVVVTTPEVPAITDAVKTIKETKQLKKNDIGVVINRVRDDSYELTRDEVEIMCETPIIGIIPEDSSLRRANFENMSAIHREPYSSASIQLKNMAARMLGVDYTPPNFLPIRRALNKLGVGV